MLVTTTTMCSTCELLQGCKVFFTYPFSNVIIFQFFCKSGKRDQLGLMEAINIGYCQKTFNAQGAVFKLLVLKILKIIIP